LRSEGHRAAREGHGASSKVAATTKKPEARSGFVNSVLLPKALRRRNWLGCVFRRTQVSSDAVLVSRENHDFIQQVIAPSIELQRLSDRTVFLLDSLVVSQDVESEPALLRIHLLQLEAHSRNRSFRSLAQGEVKIVAVSPVLQNVQFGRGMRNQSTLHTKIADGALQLLVGCLQFVLGFGNVGLGRSDFRLHTTDFSADGGDLLTLLGLGGTQLGLSGF